MSTWLKCIKCCKRNNNSSAADLTNSAEEQGIFEYSQEKLYLGTKGILKLNDANHTVIFSYAIHDGIMWKMKRNNPYKVLFEYCDGNYFINNTDKSIFLSLVNELNRIHMNTYCDQAIFSELKRISVSFLKEYMRYL